MDGRNPAPVDRLFIPVLFRVSTGFLASTVFQYVSWLKTVIMVYPLGCASQLVNGLYPVIYGYIYILYWIIWVIYGL